MFLFIFTLFYVCSLCGCEEGDLGYSLHIGNAIDVFANYGDLSQVTQVVSADYEEDDDQEPIEPFREKNIRVFVNVSSIEQRVDRLADMNMQLCETLEDLLDSYFSNFKIEGTNKPWKAFMGDWIVDEILRTFGIAHDPNSENCCYVLVQLTKMHKTVQIGDLTNVKIKDYVKKAIDNMDIRETSEVRQFMKSYGTHYIDSYVTGNFVYQVYKFKRSGFNILKTYFRSRNNRHTRPVDLRFYFSSYFLKQIGDIRIASGNKTIESWARRNLRDSQYLYSRPSLLRLNYSPILAYKLKDMFDNGALLGLNLKTLRPLFKDPYLGDKYAEVIENDMRLWEVNA